MTPRFEAKFEKQKKQKSIRMWKTEGVSHILTL